MRHFFRLIIFLCSIYISAQIQNPVSWKSELKELSNQEYEAVLTATINSGWHIYSKDLPEDSGIPTSVSWTPNPNIQLVGSLQEIGKKYDEFSKAFNAQIIYYSNQVIYKQKLKLKTAKPTMVKTTIEWQVCNDKVCLAPEEEEFIFKITPKIIESENSQSKEEEDKKEDTVSSVISPDFSQPDTSSSKSVESLIIPSLNIKNPLTKDCGEATLENDDDSYLTLFLLGFLGGILALLTPCVYPMIPLTISYFTKKIEHGKGKKDALVYAIFIFIIFASLALPFFVFENINENIFNAIATSIWLNLFFFFVFVFFAFSFFGFYEITLPSWMVNKTDKASDSGGLAGLFFMALTLVIISFSCTGPILGSLLGTISGNNGPTKLLMGLSGFGLAWALAFGFFAFFPQTLAKLPKSGGWLNTIKVILGFLELALALKFLSKADLVAKTFYLKRELFIGIWAGIFILMAIYLFGFIKFPHDDKKEKISRLRMGIGYLSLAIGIYLTVSMFPSQQSNLKWLSGITPPQHISYYHKGESCPLGLNCYHDYEQAIEMAKKENKPVLIDFTGYGCENCRKMEEFVWGEPDILPILNNQVVLASLYVDDKEELPANEQITVTLKNGKQRTINTIGEKWSVFQTENFNSNSQPQYILVTPDNQIINYPVAGYMDKEEFKAFLECGIDYYDKQFK